MSDDKCVESKTSTISSSNVKKRKLLERVEESYDESGFNYPETVKLVKKRLKQLCFLTESTLQGNESQVRAYRCNNNMVGDCYFYPNETIYLARNKAEALLKIDVELCNLRDTTLPRRSEPGVIDYLLDEDIFYEEYASEWWNGDSAISKLLLENPSLGDEITMKVLQHAFSNYDHPDSIGVKEVKLIE